MILRALLTASIALSVTAPSFADKFHFGKSDESEKTVGNAKSRAVEGVLIKQDDTTYTIRFVGGEMTVAKSLVHKVEADGLTVAQIENREKDQSDAVAKSETKRREFHAAEASATKRAAPATAEPAAKDSSIVIEVDFQGLLPGYTFRTYDPVLRRANLSGLSGVIEDYLRRQVPPAAHRHAR